MLGANPLGWVYLAQAYAGVSAAAPTPDSASGDKSYPAQYTIIIRSN